MFKRMSNTTYFILMMTIVLGSVWAYSVHAKQKIIEIRKREALSHTLEKTKATRKLSSKGTVIPRLLKPVEIECIAYAVYHEARGESLKGQMLVADVIRNRTFSKRYPNHACDVIKQPHQFSFWTGKWKPVKDKKTYKKILAMVEKRQWKQLSAGSKWYFRKELRPKIKWDDELEVAMVEENHIFFK